MTKKHPDPHLEAWYTEASTVRPLKGKQAAPAPSTPASPPLPRRPSSAQPSPSFTTPSPQYEKLTFQEHTATRIAAITPNLDAKVLKDLAAGKLTPTAAIDLHGHKEHEAFQSLMQWIHDAAGHDHRCVIVVTGKGVGYGPNRDMGILKWQVPQWLAAHPKVLALHTALPYDGGTGALYVYLRRTRIY